MDYQALYRKYRPQRFDAVIGQDHVTKTLSREIVEGKIAHAYLFVTSPGPAGGNDRPQSSEKAEPTRSGRLWAPTEG